MTNRYSTANRQLTVTHTNADARIGRCSSIADITGYRSEQCYRGCLNRFHME